MGSLPALSKKPWREITRGNKSDPAQLPFLVCSAPSAVLRWRFFAVWKDFQLAVSWFIEVLGDIGAGISVSMYSPLIWMIAAGYLRTDTCIGSDGSREVA